MENNKISTSRNTFIYLQNVFFISICYIFILLLCEWSIQMINCGLYCMFCMICYTLPTYFSLSFLFLSFFFPSKKSKYTSRVNLQGAKLIICQWFAPFLFKSPELMTMSPFKSQNLLPWIYKTGPLIWVTIALLSPSLSLNSRQQTKAKKRYEG